jgi:hypothetical protein
MHRSLVLPWVLTLYTLDVLSTEPLAQADVGRLLISKPIGSLDLHKYGCAALT